MTYRRKALFTLVETAQKMLAEEIGPIEGSRKISRLRFDVEDEESNVFNSFIAIDSESDDVVVGKRALWAEAFLEDIDRRHEVYDRALRPGIADDCRALLAIFVPRLFECPVCGFMGTDQPPSDAAAVPSYETCRSCGMEFGSPTLENTTSRNGAGAGYRTGCRSAILRPRRVGTPDAQMRAAKLA
jgi:hypothetical protein